MPRDIEEDDEYELPDCPLCLDELDIADRNFYPCACSYQLCRFCWNRILNDHDGRCPACRQPYDRDKVTFKAIDPEEFERLQKEKKQKDKIKKQLEANNRKNLSNMRVIQRNLVYITNIPPSLTKEEVLRKYEYFGQYGKVLKVVVNKSHAYNVGHPHGPSFSAYITYERQQDALLAIQAVDGFWIDGRSLRASFGTTKYCSYFLRGTQCTNPECMYLHQLGGENDSFTKEDMSAGKHLFHDHAHAVNASSVKPPPEGVQTVLPSPAFVRQQQMQQQLMQQQQQQQQQQVQQQQQAAEDVEKAGYGRGTGAATRGRRGKKMVGGIAVNAESVEKQRSILPAHASWAGARSGSAKGKESEEPGTSKKSKKDAAQASTGRGKASKEKEEKEMTAIVEGTESSAPGKKIGGGAERAIPKGTKSSTTTSKAEQATSRTSANSTSGVSTSKNPPSKAQVAASNASTKRGASKAVPTESRKGINKVEKAPNPNHSLASAASAAPLSSTTSTTPPTSTASSNSDQQFAVSPTTSDSSTDFPSLSSVTKSTSPDRHTTRLPAETEGNGDGDDLGFDPWAEGAMGLADFIESPPRQASPSPPDIVSRFPTASPIVSSSSQNLSSPHDPFEHHLLSSAFSRQQFVGAPDSIPGFPPISPPATSTSPSSIAAAPHLVNEGAHYESQVRPSPDLPPGFSHPAFAATGMNHVASNETGNGNNPNASGRSRFDFAQGKEDEENRWVPTLENFPTDPSALWLGSSSVSAPTPPFSSWGAPLGVPAGFMLNSAVGQNPNNQISNGSTEGGDARQGVVPVTEIYKPFDAVIKESATQSRPPGLSNVGPSEAPPGMFPGMEGASGHGQRFANNMPFFDSAIIGAGHIGRHLVPPGHPLPFPFPHQPQQQQHQQPYDRSAWKEDEAALRSLMGLKPAAAAPPGIPFSASSSADSSVKSTVLGESEKEVKEEIKSNTSSSRTSTSNPEIIHSLADGPKQPQQQNLKVEKSEEGSRAISDKSIHIESSQDSSPFVGPRDNAMGTSGESKQEEQSTSNSDGQIEKKSEGKITTIESAASETPSVPEERVNGKKQRKRGKKGQKSAQALVQKKASSNAALAQEKEQRDINGRKAIAASNNSVATTSSKEARASSSSSSAPSTMNRSTPASVKPSPAPKESTPSEGNSGTAAQQAQKQRQHQEGRSATVTPSTPSVTNTFSQTVGSVGASKKGSKNPVEAAVEKCPPPAASLSTLARSRCAEVKDMIDEFHGSEAQHASASAEELEKLIASQILFDHDETYRILSRQRLSPDDREILLRCVSSTASFRYSNYEIEQLEEESKVAKEECHLLTYELREIAMRLQKLM